jgi:hypothetical protein
VLLFISLTRTFQVERESRQLKRRFEDLESLIACDEGTEAKQVQVTQKRKTFLVDNLDRAWDALSNEQNIKPTECVQLHEYLSQLGITKAVYLDYANSLQLSIIARHLKEVPCKVFLEAFNKRHDKPRF